MTTLGYTPPCHLRFLGNNSINHLVSSDYGLGSQAWVWVSVCICLHQAQCVCSLLRCPRLIPKMTEMIGRSVCKFASYFGGWERGRLSHLRAMKNRYWGVRLYLDYTFGSLAQIYMCGFPFSAILTILDAHPCILTNACPSPGMAPHATIAFMPSPSSPPATPFTLFFSFHIQTKVCFL